MPYSYSGTSWVGNDPNTDWNAAPIDAQTFWDTLGRTDYLGADYYEMFLGAYARMNDPKVEAAVDRPDLFDIFIINSPTGGTLVDVIRKGRTDVLQARLADDPGASASSGYALVAAVVAAWRAKHAGKGYYFAGFYNGQHYYTTGQGQPDEQQIAIGITSRPGDGSIAPLVHPAPPGIPGGTPGPTSDAVTTRAASEQAALPSPTDHVITSIPVAGAVIQSISQNVGVSPTTTAIAIPIGLWLLSQLLKEA
jgi:hypothetical protein